MSKKPDYARLAGLALVAAAIALYARDCRRTRAEQRTVAAIRAAASDPGALVAFGIPDPHNPGARVFRPVRDAAVASNIVAALAATEPGWKPDHGPSSLIVDHDVMLLDHNRRSAFFRLRRSDGDSLVMVERLAGPPPAESVAGDPPMSAAGLSDVLKRIEHGELIDEFSGIRIVPVPPPTNDVPAAAEAPAAPTPAPAE